MHWCVVDGIAAVARVERAALVVEPTETRRRMFFDRRQSGTPIERARGCNVSSHRFDMIFANDRREQDFLEVADFHAFATVPGGAHQHARLIQIRALAVRLPRLRSIASTSRSQPTSHPAFDRDATGRDTGFL